MGHPCGEIGSVHTSSNVKGEKQVAFVVPQIRGDDNPALGSLSFEDRVGFVGIAEFAAGFDGSVDCAKCGHLLAPFR